MSLDRASFTFLACADLKRIREAIATPSEVWHSGELEHSQAAASFVAELERHCALLAETPEIGTSREELRHELKSSRFQRYVIFYRTRGGAIEVLRLLRAGLDSGLSA